MTAPVIVRKGIHNMYATGVINVKDIEGVRTFLFEK